MADNIATYILAVTHEMPEYAIPWAKKRLEKHLRSLANKSTEPTGWAFAVGNNINDVHAVADWLHSLPVERPKMPGKLYKITWEQAVDASRKWHLQMENRKDKNAHKVGCATDVKLFLESTDKYRWVRITSSAGLDYEGAMMRHCVGKGGYDDSTSYIILSLRDEHNVPHCTVGYREMTRDITEVQCCGNTPLTEDMVSHIEALVSYIRPNRILPFIEINGKVLASVNRQPFCFTDLASVLDADRVDMYELCIGINSRIITLPRNLFIEGDLTVIGPRQPVVIPLSVIVIGNVFYADIPFNMDIPSTIGKCLVVIDSYISRWPSQLRVRVSERITIANCPYLPEPPRSAASSYDRDGVIIW